MQETFLVITAKAGDFSKRGTNFRAWAWTIARYKVLQTLEKNAPVPERFAPDVLEALAAHNTAETWYSDEQIQHLAKCMEGLAPKAREAVELRYQQAHRPPGGDRQPPPRLDRRIRPRRPVAGAGVSSRLREPAHGRRRQRLKP